MAKDKRTLHKSGSTNKRCLAAKVVAAAKAAPRNCCIQPTRAHNASPSLTQYQNDEFSGLCTSAAAAAKPTKSGMIPKIITTMTTMMTG